MEEQPLKDSFKTSFWLKPNAFFSLFHSNDHVDRFVMGSVFYCCRSANNKSVVFDKRLQFFMES